MRQLNPFARNPNNLGFNLIEAAIVLGIVGIVIGGIFAAWSNITSTQRVRKAADQTIAIVSQIRSTYAARATFDSTDQDEINFTKALVSANLIPIEYQSGTDIINPWGGKVTVLPDATSMTLKYTAIPQGDCLKFAGAVFNAATKQGMSELNGGATGTLTIKNLGASACTATGVNTITFKFLLKSN